HAKRIEKKVRETFPSIPAGFTLQLVTIRKTIGCGMFYDFKIVLPDGQFAKVSFDTGDYPIPRDPDAPESEQLYTVYKTPSSSEYE
ncbi:unnamed protein product, partial [Rotaria sp. Silwood1]